MTLTLRADISSPRINCLVSSSAVWALDIIFVTFVIYNLQKYSRNHPLLLPRRKSIRVSMTSVTVIHQFKCTVHWLGRGVETCANLVEVLSSVSTETSSKWRTDSRNTLVLESSMHNTCPHSSSTSYCPAIWPNNGYPCYFRENGYQQKHNKIHIENGAPQEVLVSRNGGGRRRTKGVLLEFKHL